MGNTTNKLKKLDLILEEKNAPILNYLNPGLSRHDIIEFFKKKDITLNQRMIALYEWHNGIDFIRADVLQPVIELLPMGIFYTLDYMIEKKNELVEWDYLELGDLNEYLPLLGSGEDDTYLLKQTTGEIFYIAPAIQILGTLEFKSIDAMLDCMIECYKGEIFTIDSVDGFDVNYEEFSNKKEKYR